MQPDNLMLLPQHRDSLLINKSQKANALTVAGHLTRLAVEAIEAFINCRLSLFDAQVGENLCQIRAYKIQTISLKYRK